MKATQSTREAYGEALLELGKVNEKVVVLDADLSRTTKTNLFAKHFPDRFFNMGVAEQNMIGVAAGLSLEGWIPFASTLAVFAAGRCFDQIRQSVAYARTNVKIGATHAGLSVGPDGATHQALEDLSLMRSLPNMTVVVPADAVATKKIVETAAQFMGPVYIRLGRAEVPLLYSEDSIFEIGKCKTIREGKDVTILTNGYMVWYVMEAAKELERKGLSCRIVDVYTIKPADCEGILEAILATGAAVVVEEHSVIGGLRSLVCELLVERRVNVPFVNIGVNDSFGETGEADELINKYGLGVNSIICAVQKCLSLN